jgi:hypothetical protein
MQNNIFQYPTQKTQPALRCKTGCILTVSICVKSDDVIRILKVEGIRYLIQNLCKVKKREFLGAYKGQGHWNIILKWILGKLGGKVWSGRTWLRIRTGGKPL